MSFGPALPPHLQRKPEQGDESEEEGEEASIGPALPPHLQKKKGKADETSIGPSLPPATQSSTSHHRDDSDDDDDVIGPLPPGAATSAASSNTQRQLDVRAERLRDQAGKAAASGEGQGPKRESWMVELPPEKAQSFGLGPRTFSKGSAKPQRDSSWTDTPEDRARKAAMAAGGGDDADTGDSGATDPEVVEYLAGLKRDQEMEKTAKALKAKRGESLYESHQSKKVKKETEKASTKGATTRRPFDRETDLQVNRFDEAAKVAMLKKARKMDDRFVSGQSKYI